MSNEKINSQIALLQEQIYNLEQSGHFTEKEMDSQTFALRQEIEALQSQLLPIEKVLGVSEDEVALLVKTLKSCFTADRIAPTPYGMSPGCYIEGSRFHKQYFSQMPSPALLNTWNTLKMEMSFVSKDDDSKSIDMQQNHFTDSWNIVGRELKISKG